MEANTIQKYKGKTVAELKRLATDHFNLFIRSRDEGQPCISCGHRWKLQAGHYYSGGHFPWIKFDEDNVHGQCKQCNYFGSMETGVRYTRNLVKKIGEDRVQALVRKAEQRIKFKWDRFTLIEVIEVYKAKNKLL